MISNLGTRSDIITPPPRLPVARHLLDRNSSYRPQLLNAAFPSSACSYRHRGMTHFNLSCGFCCWLKKKTTANRSRWMPLISIQIRATLHPTGKRHEHRWGESRSDGRRWRVNRDKRGRQGGDTEQETLYLLHLLLLIHMECPRNKSILTHSVSLNSRCCPPWCQGDCSQETGIRTRELRHSAWMWQSN